jgi:N-acetylmuramoyl-L-alanine amidase
MPSFGNVKIVATVVALALTGAVWPGAPTPAGAATRGSAKQMYTTALARERTLRDADARPSLKQLRALAASYERVVHRFPRSGYSDNALWQAAGVYALAYERFAQESDRRKAQKLLSRLSEEYPSSSLRARVSEIAQVLVPRVVPAARKAAPPPAAAAPAPASPPPVAGEMPPVATLQGVKRTELGNVVRITLEMDSEIAYHEERLHNPERVFFDLKNVRLGEHVGERALTFDGDVVPQVRVGRRGDSTARVAMDLDGVTRYSVFTLYNPYRLVVDFERGGATTATVPTAVGSNPVPTSGVAVSSTAAASTPPKPAPERPLPSTPAKETMAAAPDVPAANHGGNYSIARQLGLGIARIVIDPGHGGRDPGAAAHRVTEAELVLDVALRLEKLLQKERGMDVVMTRRTDVFIPLEERTAIANKAGADLFLSIHANASENRKASGVETYYLNFASNPEAEAVAARENSASGRTMHALPEILRAIALNDKLDESRDFAELVQRSMTRRLRAQNGNLRSLGVKRAPFVVLIGASMPSVLAEISFVTNKEEAALLRTGAYRQRIAQALFDAVTQYQRSLKKVTAIADSAAR